MDWMIYVLSGVAAAIVLGGLVFQQRRNLLQARLSIRETLAACRNLQALIGHFQQHRGMSSAWLSGDKTFTSKLERKAQEIDALFVVLRPIAITESGRAHPCLTANDLSLCRHRWRALRDKLDNLSVEESIVEHGGIIDQLLGWLAALGEARVEPLLAGHELRGMVRDYAACLPALTECLGQARAVGLSVATRRTCSAVARVRLMFLITRAETILQRAADGGTPHWPATHARRAVQQMIGLLRERIMVTSEVNMTAQEYFDGATLAIDAVFGWIAENGRLLADTCGPVGEWQADVTAAPEWCVKP